MKFLCDNCKAKYQIADEKVAGKTVRMKCRKCGHQIEVRAAVTETSVSTAPPKAPSDAPAARPGVQTRGNLATSLAGQKPRAPVPPQAAMTQPMGGAAGTGALAGAFQRTVQDGPASGPAPNTTPAERELSVTDEWYVAINGVPVGPVRISELRRKAAAGAVTEDSLCWQEGLEEWRPVRTVPDLAALVREAAQGNRPSLTAPAPGDQQRASSPPRAPQRPAAPPARTPEPPRASEPPAPRPFQAPAPQRSNVVPLRPAAQSSGDDMFGSLGGGGGAAAAFAPQLTPQPTASPFAQPQGQPQPQMQSAPVPIADPFALPPPATAPLAAPLGSSPTALPATASGAIAPIYPSVPPPARRQGPPLWFWLVALFVVGFGGVAAYALFLRPVPPPPAPVVIQMPATNTAPTGDIPPPSTADTAPAATTSATGTKIATGPAKAGTGPAPAPTEKKGATDISGLLGGGGAGGPGVGGGGPGPSGAGGGTLDQASVERTVAAHRTGVKRTCWERGGNDQKSSVNVTVSATVGPDGSVTNTSSSGDDPQVAKCIENNVRGWKFGASGSTTTINIPFKFVRQ